MEKIKDFRERVTMFVPSNMFLERELYTLYTTSAGHADQCFRDVE